ncbi:Crp/Fnr family transcriptional regulator [Kitasatospora purpeofusca]|uniref:Crp/Fnr family transcriptional regulator n=1 Tax=Kitasatospora purpeofusca TaxID=67352 RepID=UPI00068A3D87|nr:Crp/Fnr family transcriptional regulator [Kitasatospora purpeofusca]
MVGSALPAEWRDLIRSAGHEVSWRRGEVLIREGETPDRVVLLERGLVKITAASTNGFTSVLAIRGPGELIGELSCVDGETRSATATAMASVSGVALAAPRFITLMEAHGGFALAVLRFVAVRLRESDIGRSDLGALPTVARTALVLARLSRNYGSPVPGPGGGAARRLAVNQQELAGAVGASRESVVRVLRELTERRLVAVSRGQILVHDPAALAVWPDTA